MEEATTKINNDEPLNKDHLNYNTFNNDFYQTGNPNSVFNSWYSWSESNSLFGKNTAYYETENGVTATDINVLDDD